MLLEWMERALDLIPGRSKLINSIFEFEALNYIEAKEQDGTPVTSTIKSVDNYLVRSCPIAAFSLSQTFFL